MSFSLQAINPDGGERDAYLSLNNRAMTDLRAVIVEADHAPGDSPVAKLVFNDGERVHPDECRWLAGRLRSVDRAAIRDREPGGGELLELVDELAEFCELCASVGGFEVR